MKALDFSQLPRVHDIQDCAAQMRVLPEDFQVDEDLPFSPKGEGSHVWLYIRKKNTNTDWLAQHLARFANVSPVAVGYAGIKDRHAVTSQWFSINLQGLDEPEWSALESDEITVVQCVRHDRKLKRGVLSGNRFTIKLKNVLGDIAVWQQHLQHISRFGVPNYFAEQRFGHGGMNLQKADAWFNGGQAPQKRNQRSMIISAARSWLFNLVLAERIRQHKWDQGIAGDIMLLSGTRASYFLADVIDEMLTTRLSEMDIHPSGPLWGKGDTPNKAQSLTLEKQVLANWQVWKQQLEKLGLNHERRALRLFPSDLNWQFEADGLVLKFALTPGSYATAVLRELANVIDSSQKILAE